MNPTVTDSTAVVTDEKTISDKKKFAINLLKAAAPTLIVAAAIFVLDRIANSDND